MGTRQEWGLLFCIVLLMAARLLDYAPLASRPASSLACEYPIEIQGRAEASGLICPRRGDGDGLAAALGAVLPADCPLPGHLPPAALLALDAGPGQDCRVRLDTMSGQHRLLVAQGIDPNTASAADLQAIPGIGPTLSQRIVENRDQHGPFVELADLARVRGIGPKTLARMSPYLSLAR